MFDTALPIDQLFPQLEQALQGCQQLIIHAPPGAGKSTRLPLWLLLQGRFAKEKVYLIQPRRLAASNVAGFLADQLDESVGGRIGLRTRYETKVSNASVIEVMTEGVFVRLIQSDPELAGVACVIFDEFHERSLQLDLGLALANQCQELLREPEQPMLLMVMSATLAAEQLQQKLPDAQLLACEGRCFPVETHYEPVPGHQDWLDHLPNLLKRILGDHEGSVLVFLPGMREIRQIERRLQTIGLEQGTHVFVLHSSLPAQEQKAVLKPSPSGERKIVLATNIAETSITIDGISVVVDSGLARVPFFDRSRGITQLRTQRISKAAATQREGRAGRLQAGDCYRLWSKDIHHSLLDYDVPEIIQGDLSSFLLELAVWGETDCRELLLVDTPDQHQLAYAHGMLGQLQALDHRGVITTTGKQLSSLGLHPRLAAMCVKAKEEGDLPLACLLAVMISEGDIFSQQVDFERSVEALIKFHRQQVTLDNHLKFQANRLIKQAKQILKRVDRRVTFELKDYLSAVGLLAEAFPDRLAKQRSSQKSGSTNTQELRYQLASGQEVCLRNDSSLVGSPFLLILEYGGQTKAPVIFKACLVAGETLDLIVGQRSVERKVCFWDPGTESVVARKQLVIDQLIISETPIKAEPEQLQSAWLSLVQDRGLSLLNTQKFEPFQQRLLWACEYTDLTLPDVSDSALLSSIEAWLGPYLLEVKSLNQLKKICIYELLHAQLDWGVRQQLDVLAPEFIALPSGIKHVVEYGRFDQPVVSAKLTEFYGWQETPRINQGKEQLLLEMLSPAGRPLQLTAELSAFWTVSYRDIQKEMKGRYPKHFWPDDPANAKATVKTKKRMD